jgi:hypothetical protein
LLPEQDEAPPEGRGRWVRIKKHPYATGNCNEFRRQAEQWRILCDGPVEAGLLLLLLENFNKDIMVK